MHFSKGLRGGALAFSIAAAMLGAAGSAARAAENYETVLGPTPLSEARRQTTSAAGVVLAVLDGQSLKIELAFAGLGAAATDVQLMKGAGIGLPGSATMPIGPVSGQSAKLSVTLKLSRDQLAALRAGQLYVQVNSQTTPALWGWLLPFHVKAGQDEPQTGDWFLPQGQGLKAPSRGRIY